MGEEGDSQRISAVSERYAAVRWRTRGFFSGGQTSTPREERSFDLRIFSYSGARHG